VSRIAVRIVTRDKKAGLSATERTFETEMGQTGSKETAASLTERLRSQFGLTAAESRVALAVSEGLSYAEIARRLSISTHTVHTHVKELHQKLGVHSNGRAAAIIRSLEYQK
jgi:DNA-binding CsgD family transcriptional regulator